jgi:hypothetical protein
MRTFALLGSVVVFGAIALSACSSDDDPAPPAGNGGSGSTTLGGCYPTDPACGIVGSKCLAREDMKGQDVKTLRLGQLQITAPSSLANNAVAGLVGNAITQISNQSTCHLFATKPGNFNFLIQLDTVKNTLLLGGGLPQPDPDAGYCLVTRTFDNGLTSQPITIPVDYNADTQMFGTTEALELNVPIFDPANDPQLVAPILLPLKGTFLKNVQLSEDGACIGRFRGEEGELDEDCGVTTSNAAKDDYYPFQSGGDLEGYILVKDAEAVQVIDLKATLCALLSGQTSKGKCTQDDGTIGFGSGTKPDLDTDGDGEMDAYRLAARIAGSSVKLNGPCE